MSAAEFSVGDRVSHFREADNIGTVVAVERHGHVFLRWVYYVQWRVGFDPVPLRDGLRHATAPSPIPTV